MEESPNEAPAGSLAPESTAKSLDDSHTDGQEDNWQDQDEEEVDDQTDPRTAEQRMSGQTDHKGSEPTGRQTSDRADLSASDHANVAQRSASDQDDQRTYEQTDSRTSSQANHVQSEQTDSEMFLPREQRTSEQIGRRRSSQAEGRDYGQMDRRLSSPTEERAHEQSNQRLSSQSDRRPSEQIGRRLSVSSEQGASEQMGCRMSSQADKRTSEQIDSRLSGLVERRTSEKTSHRPANQVDPVTPVKTHQEVYEEAAGIAEQQAADQAEGTADHLPADKPDYSDQMGRLMDEENYYKDYVADYGALDQYDDRLFAQFGDSKRYEEAEPRIEPCKFETRDINGDNSPASAETESSTDLQASDSFGARFTSNLQAKDQVYSQRFPCISSKLDYIISREKTEAIETKSDDIPEYQEGRKSFGYDQTYRRQFPPIIYEDPYQVSLRYMEKHHILQIFQQITENLVCEKPEDPLSFMLCQVQEMIANRDKSETYKE
ncbi:testis-specific expressed protein 55 isoform X4 [Ursus arctos]|uniref:testis-specific expressed protein 55 isoform X4 n=1 Tax=Ursus arctos TaxID=9644 RepID=UPI0020175544|nr:testis-specific expressed protein 55 isoform X4 [Ursus arctos]